MKKKIFVQRERSLWKEEVNYARRKKVIQGRRGSIRKKGVLKKEEGGLEGGEGILKRKREL